MARPGHESPPKMALCGWVNFLFGFSCAMTWYGSVWWIAPTIVLAIIDAAMTDTGWQ